jgi:hypothetical protein
MSISYMTAEYATAEETMIRVVAPANLPEGYIFNAEVSPGRSFRVFVVSAFACRYREFDTVVLLIQVSLHHQPSP